MDNNIAQTKENIKNEINSFCNGFLNARYAGFVNAPVVMAIYLGKDTYDRVNASLKDAFTISFNIKPSLYEIQISSEIHKREFVETFKQNITEVSRQGKKYDDIRIIFVAMMDDPFFEEVDDQLIAEIGDAFSELDNFGLDVNKKAFYGLFDQNKTDKNYQYAYQFIEKGKDIWKNIYHIEIPFVAQDVAKEAELIALNLVRDDYQMRQDESDGYSWSSLCLHYLKISEFITCRLLKEIYIRQVDGNHIDTNDLNQGINQALENFFKQYLSVSDNKSYLYVPLTFQNVTEPKKTKGFFGRKKQNIQPVYNHVLKSEGVIKDLVKQIFENICFDESQYAEMIEKIITSSTSLDANSVYIGQEIINVLEKRIENIDQQQEQMSKRFVSHTNIMYVNKYLKDEYDYYLNFYKFDKEREIIQHIIEIISNENNLKLAIDDIVKKNHQYANILDELTLSEYGGTLDELQVKNLPVFQVNQSVKDILDNIDSQFIADIVDDHQSLIERLKLFLNHTLLQEVQNKHNLGVVHNNFTDIQPINSFILLTPQLNSDNDISVLLQDYLHLLTNVNDIFRDNSFFIISSRNYNSDQYIVKYKRGG